MPDTSSPAAERDERDEQSPTLPAPGRERLYGRFDGIPPQTSTMRNLAARRRVIE